MRRVILATKNDAAQKSVRGGDKGALALSLENMAPSDGRYK
jgi:hypothetical protein